MILLLRIDTNLEEEEMEQAFHVPYRRIVFENVPVKLWLPWKEVVAAAGPDTPKDGLAYKISQYSSTGPAGGVINKTVVLVNFQGVSVAAVIPFVWGKKQKLPLAGPRTTCALVSNKLQTLHRKIEGYSFRIVALESPFLSNGKKYPVSVYCCKNGTQKVCLSEMDSSWPADSWFAFSVPNQPEKELKKAA